MRRKELLFHPTHAKVGHVNPGKDGFSLQSSTKHKRHEKFLKIPREVCEVRQEKVKAEKHLNLEHFWQV
jgi:hypothetical protein